MNNFSLPSSSSNSSLYARQWIHQYLSSAHKKAKISNYIKEKSADKWAVKLSGINKNLHNKSIVNFNNDIITSSANNESDYYMIELVLLISTFTNENKLYLIKDDKNYSLAIITKQCENLFYVLSNKALLLSSLVTSNLESCDVSKCVMSLDSGNLTFFNFKELFYNSQMNLNESLFNINKYNKSSMVWPIFTVDKISLSNVEFLDAAMDRVTKEYTDIKKYYRFNERKNINKQFVSLNKINSFNYAIKFCE